MPAGATFTKLLSRFSMKPKLDWVQEKIQQIQKQSPPGFPENATIMIVAIYDLTTGRGMNRDTLASNPLA
jgi:hypothetical protein